MQIVLKNVQRDFQAAVILRTLYYGTGLKNTFLWIDHIRNPVSFARYSRTPIEVIRSKVKTGSPRELRGNIYVIDPDAKDSIKDVDKIDTLIVDFSRKTNEYPKVKAMGIQLLEYEAIAVIYELFIRRSKTEIPDLGNKEIPREAIYFARKIVEGIRYLDSYPLVSPRLIIFALRHLVKKHKLLIDPEKTEIKTVDPNGKLKMKIKIKYYNKALREVGEDEIILDENILEVPIWTEDDIVRVRFFIDYDRKKVYLSRNFYVSEAKSQKEVLEDFTRFL